MSVRARARRDRVARRSVRRGGWIALAAVGLALAPPGAAGPLRIAPSGRTRVDERGATGRDAGPGVYFLRLETPEGALGRVVSQRYYPRAEGGASRLTGV